MAITADQAGELAQAYQSGSGNLQDLVNTMGVTQSDVNQYFPGFDVGASGLSLPSATSSSPLASAPVAETSSQSAPVNTATTSPLSGSATTPNQLSGVVLAGDSWLANNDLNTPYIQKELGSTPVTNTAVGGSTSGDSLNQLNNFISGGGTFAPGTTVVLDAGGNDLLQGIPRDQIMKNLSQISQTLASQGVKVILSGAPAINNVSDVTGSSGLGIDPLYNQVASNNPNVTVVDAMSPLLNQKNLVDSSGFHMNSAGQMGYDTTLANAVLKLQGKGPITFTNDDIAQFAKDNNLTTDQAIALAPSFGVSKDQVTQALAPATPFSSPLAPPTANDPNQYFNQTYNALQYGNTKLAQNGTNDDGSPTYGIVDGSGKPILGSNVIDVGNGIYDIQIGSGGGIIHTYTNLDAKGNLNPIKDYNAQVVYTGGNKGGFVNQTAAGLAGLSSVAAPAAAILSGNPEFADLANTISGTLAGANTVNSINNGNVPGAVLSALGVANALPTGTLPFDPSTLKTATNIASGVNALAKKDIFGLAKSVLNETGAGSSVDPQVKIAMTIGSLASSIAKGDPNGMLNASIALSKSTNPTIANQAQKVVDASQNGGDVTQPANELNQYIDKTQKYYDYAISQGMSPTQAAMFANDPTGQMVNTVATAQSRGQMGGEGSGTWFDSQGNLHVGNEPQTIVDELLDQVSKPDTTPYVPSAPLVDANPIPLRQMQPIDTNWTDFPIGGGNGANIGEIGEISGNNGVVGNNGRNINIPNGPITDIGVIGGVDRLPPEDEDNIESINVTTSPLGGQTVFNPTTGTTKISDDVVPNVNDVPTITVTGKKIPTDESLTTTVTPTTVTPPTTTTTPTSVSLPSTITKTPTTTTQATTPLGGSSTKDSFLPMVATMLAGAPMYNEKHKLAQLHQLYDSLDPHLAKVLQQAGIIPPEPPKEEKTQTDEEKILASAKQAEPEKAQSFLGLAGGGSALEEANAEFKKQFEKPSFMASAPSMLSAAPVVGTAGIGNLHTLSPLKHLKQGIRKDAQPTSLLAQGGLPHKYQKALPEGHKPEFITGLTGYYADGRGTGQSDDIPAMLHEGDYVMDADTVASFGDGSSKAGAQVMDKLHHEVPHKMAVGGTPVPAKIADGEYVFPESFVTALGGGDNKLGSKLLDTMREELRAHKRSAPDTKIPPKAKSPLEYLKMAKG